MIGDVSETLTPINKVKMNTKMMNQWRSWLGKLPFEARPNWISMFGNGARCLWFAGRMMTQQGHFRHREERPVKRLAHAWLLKMKKRTCWTDVSCKRAVGERVVS